MYSKSHLDLSTDRILRRFGFDPFEDLQILTPMHKGAVGAVSLNSELQKALNQAEEGVPANKAVNTDAKTLRFFGTGYARR